jgi:hypothetical protein
MEVNMAGEVNLRKLKEVAQRLGIESKGKKKRNTYLSPYTLLLTHEFVCDMPKIVEKDDVSYVTGTSYYNDKEIDQ